MKISDLYKILLMSFIKCKELKSIDAISNYKIKFKKENEKIGADGVPEFDAKIDVYIEPKKSAGYIKNNITIMKRGDDATKH